MIDYTLSSLSERLDTNFLTSSWMPAFVAVLTHLGLLTWVVGPDAVAEWLTNLDAFEETIVAVILLVAITVVALILRALSYIIVAFFVGESMPRIVAEWLTRGQERERVRAHAEQNDTISGPAYLPLHEQVRRLIEQRYPRDKAALRPTRLGNVLATAAEYPWIVYGADGLLWYPHLWPSLPSYVSDPMDGAQSRMLGLLNLSLVCSVLAGEGILVLGLAGQRWTAAVVWTIVGVVAARFCYQAAVNQAREVGSQIRAAFNLYRHEILKQMDVNIPVNLAAERELWQILTKELLGQPTDLALTGANTEAAAATTDAPTGDGTETAAGAEAQVEPSAADSHTR
ncbi:MAG: hypothetical protein ACJ8DJ_03070 [Gemmatimonadales bacterium]